MNIETLINRKERQVIKNVRFPIRDCEQVEAIARQLSTPHQKVTATDIYRAAVRAFLTEIRNQQQSVK